MCIRDSLYLEVHSHLYACHLIPHLDTVRSLWLLLSYKGWARFWCLKIQFDGLVFAVGSCFRGFFVSWFPFCNMFGEIFPPDLLVVYVVTSIFYVELSLCSIVFHSGRGISYSFEEVSTCDVLLYVADIFLTLLECLTKSSRLSKFVSSLISVIFSNFPINSCSKLFSIRICSINISGFTSCVLLIN